ncbi:hypothetical protein [Vibrio sp. R78045]|uniref:hypothetical protein n=1 Tax=Vibrio sp. R78045 TaxID=3093868 RepID=UPI0036F3C960
MEILIADKTRFGVVPNGKRLMPTSNGLYLITNGENPSKAERAVFTAEFSFVTPQKIKSCDSVAKYLKSKNNVVWNINCAESKRTKTVVWQECSSIESDYNVHEVEDLKESLKDLSWANSNRIRNTFCDILGVSFSNYRNISAKLVELESKSVTRMKPSAIAFFKQAADEYKDANVTVSTVEYPNKAIDQMLVENANGQMDLNGYTVERIKTKKPKTSDITSSENYVVRYKGERRKVIEERTQGKEPTGFDISKPLLKVKTKQGTRFLLHGSMPKSLGLWQVLKAEYPDLFNERIEELDLSEYPLGLTLSDLYKTGENLHSDADMLDKIRKLEIEVLTMNHTWAKIDLTKHSSLITDLVTKVDFSPEEEINESGQPISKYSLLDGKIRKENYSAKAFGFSSFAIYLLHPLMDRHAPIRSEPKNYYWMKFCLSNDIEFKYE